MTKIKIIIFLIFILNSFAINNLYAKKVEIMYKVENFPITNKDIAKEINYLIMLNDALKTIDEKELIQYATKSIIKEKVKKNEIIKNFKFGGNENLIKKQITVLRNNLNLDQSEFESLLNSLDISENFLSEKIEIELMWNKLIYTIYKDKLVIDEIKIKKKLKDDLADPSNFLDEYLLHEILFTPSQISDLETNKLKIEKSIKDIGFENTANILSEAQSSKLGGKIGWVKENQLTKEVLNNIKNLKIGDYSKPINVAGGQLFLYLKDKRKSKLDLSFDEEFKKIILAEQNRQLSQYSSIYYKKTELNTKIYDN
tara:strand:+ start:4365 stop:5303 length:939 start_codon:yes stop_codon:yes gene_type:complete